MKVVAIVCPKCHDVVWSRHRHDFRECKCGRNYIDGGRDYTRCGGKDHPLETVEIEITEELNEKPSQSNMD